MIRRSLTLAAFALVSSTFVFGCAAPADGNEDAIQETSAAWTADCESASADCDATSLDTFAKVAFTISFDRDTLQITGLNGKGQQLNATFTPATVFRNANLNRFEPTDPYLPSVRAYNDALTAATPEEGGVYSAISQLSGGTARVWVKGGTVRAFRPVASY